MANVLWALLPAIGAGVGYYVMRHKATEGKLLGLAGGVAAGLAVQSVIQNVAPGLPVFGTYQAYSVAHGSDSGVNVISGRQAGTNEYIF